MKKSYVLKGVLSETHFRQLPRALKPLFKKGIQRPTVGVEYYFVELFDNGSRFSAESSPWEDSEGDLDRYRAGNCFLEEDEAQVLADKMQSLFDN